MKAGIVLIALILTAGCAGSVYSTDYRGGYYSPRPHYWNGERNYHNPHYNPPRSGYKHRHGNRHQKHNKGGASCNNKRSVGKPMGNKQMYQKGSTIKITPFKFK